MKKVLILMVMMFSALTVKADLITLTCAGTVLGSGDSVYYSFLFDANKNGSLLSTEIGEYIYQDLSSEFETVDFFYADFQGDFFLPDHNIYSSISELNFGYNQISGNSVTQSLLLGGSGTHYVQISSADFDIDSWQVGTRLIGNERSYRNSISYSDVHLTLSITSLSSNNVPEPSILATMLCSLAGLCFITTGSFRPSKKKSKS